MYQNPGAPLGVPNVLAAQLAGEVRSADSIRGRIALMPLSREQVQRIKEMKHDDLVANAGSDDMAVFVEVALRLHRATIWLNGALILLTLALVYFAWKLS
jgi:hypothetical protein